MKFSSKNYNQHLLIFTFFFKDNESFNATLKIQKLLNNILLMYSGHSTHFQVGGGNTKIEGQEIF